MIYLIRHGLDDERYIGGWSDVNLTSEGINQVEETIEYLKQLKIKLIISSDITRAKQTADIINKYLKTSIIYTDILRELNKGDYNGKLRDSIDLTSYDDINIKYPNGESMIEFYNRITKDIKTLFKNDQTLIVTHRGVINAIYYMLNNIPIDMDKKKFNVAHASVHELNVKEKTIRRVL